MHSYSIDKKIRGRITIIIFIFSYVLSQIVQNLLEDPLKKFYDWLNTMSFSSIFNSIFSLGFIPNILEAAIIFYFLTWLFEKYVWKWRIIKKIHGIPDLNGTWIGFLQSSWSDNSINMEMLIRQNWTEISFHSVFLDSKSESFSNNAAICTESNRGQSIYFGFQNESSDIKSGMQTYDGYNILTLSDDDTIYAKYFNNRPNSKKKGAGGNMGAYQLKRKTD